MIREIRLDNLKGLAMILVIFGHLFEQTILMHAQIPYFIYICRCVLAMPIFVFVSGYLSKIGADTGFKSFKNIFIPYVLFSTLWIIFSFLETGQLSFVSYFYPAAGLWYLLCLYFWRTFLPGLNSVKYILFISILPAIYIGTIKTNLSFLSLSETIGFLPLFLFGYYFKQIKDKIQIKNVYMAFTGFIFLLLAFAIIIQNHGALLCFQFSYKTLGLTNLEGILLTSLTLVSTMVILILLYYSMTDKKTVLTKVGKNSLVVYVFHFYIFLPMPIILSHFGLSFILNNFYSSILYVTLGPVIIAYILSRDKLSEWTNKLISLFTNVIITDSKFASIQESKNKSILNSKFNSFMFRMGLRR